MRIIILQLKQPKVGFGQFVMMYVILAQVGQKKIAHYVRKNIIQNVPRKIRIIISNVIIKSLKKIIFLMKKIIVMKYVIQPVLHVTKVEMMMWQIVFRVNLALFYSIEIATLIALCLIMN